MKKVKFIYNPHSGESTIISQLDSVIKVHQKHGYTIIPYRIDINQGIDKAFEDMDESFEYILIAGGDGTVDKMVNYIKKNNITIPIAVLPSGTANDFAKFIGMPENLAEACEQIIKSKPKGIDLGKINDSYFVNVASTGLFTDVSQKTDINIKNTIGKLAYYIKGVRQLPNFRKLKIKVDSKEVVFDQDMYLMLVFNGKTAGNLNLAYKAEIDDGLLDVIIFKAIMIKDLLGLFFKVLKSEHLEDTNGIVYFKTNKLEIQCFEDIVTDIDGERGPDFPCSISCDKEGIQILGMKNK